MRGISAIVYLAVHRRCAAWVAEVISSTSYELVLYSFNDTLRGSDKRM